MDKKISVIIPVFNGEKYIERCLDSIIDQDYTNIEVICVDDDSNDNSYDIIKKYCCRDKRIKIIKNLGKGVSNARNTGIKAATGDFITFIDCDDTIEKNAYSTIINIFKTNNVSVVKYGYNKVSSSKNIEINESSKVIKSEMLLNQIITGKKNAYVWLLMIDIDVVKKNNIFFNPNLRIMEDKEFYVELLKYVKEIYEINIPLYNYYIYNTSSIRSVNGLYERIFEILKATDYIEMKLDHNEFLIKEMYNSHLLIIIEQICLLKKNKIKFDFAMITNNETYKKIFRSANFKHMRIDNKIMFLLFKHNQWGILLIYYNLLIKVKSFIGRIKK